MHPTPLARAALAGNRREFVKIVFLSNPGMRSGQLLDEVDADGNTLLHYIARGGNCAILRGVMQLGLDTREVKNALGQLPVDVATSENMIENLQYSYYSTHNGMYPMSIRMAFESRHEHDLPYREWSSLKPYREWSS